MILCVCRDDREGTWGVARHALHAHRDVFRRAHLVGASGVPKLQVNEDLYVIAHGTADGADGEPVLGDAHDDLHLDAPALWENVRTLLPDGYRASVYLSVCESADPGPGKDFSLAEALAARMKSDQHVKGRVYGHKGSVGGEVPLPGEGLWIEADRA
ncbi:hypothetical protein [Catenulispora subtropica]|uniref:CHAT domain-containing protein n=1 Tax=Catenulispora subtropica TaxID=450798 RepID=A0ABN2R6Y9_9ACTN